MASHTYVPPWEVRNGLRINVRFDVVPAFNCGPTNVSSVFPGSRHDRVGVAWRYSSTVTVQTRVFSVPAAVMEVGRMETEGG